MAATPARVTRARSKTPLPAVGARQSQAYGTSGKATLGQQLRGQSASFEEQFEESRATASTVVGASAFASGRGGSLDQDDGASEATSSRAAAQPRRHYSRRPAAIREEVEERAPRAAQQPPPQEQSVLGRDATVLDHDARYNGVFARLRAGLYRQWANPSSPFWFLALIGVVAFLSALGGIVSMFVPAPAAVVAYREHFSLGMRYTFFQQPFDTPPPVWVRYVSDTLELFKEESAKVDGLAKSAVDKWLAEKKFASIDVTRDEMHTIMRFNQVHNQFRAMHTVNWFSVGIGARIDPYLTSATKTLGGKSILGAIYDTINPLAVTPNPPITALLKWDEATECWCGTPDSKGYVQLGVITHDFFYPEEITIEHIPRAATLRPDAAPKDYEVWIDLGTEERATALRKEWEGDSYVAEKGGCGEPPGKTFFCAGKSNYDIGYKNHVQPYHLWTFAAHDKMATNKVVVRSVSNHGADYTCFYRIRMVGQKVDASEEATVDNKFVHMMLASGGR